MAHIQVPEGAPGILGPMAISPESTKALRELVEVLLRGPNTLTPAEREMIAMYVSSQNDYCFCQLSHGAAAAEHLGGDYDLIDRVKRNYATAEISDKRKNHIQPQSEPCRSHVDDSSTIPTKGQLSLTEDFLNSPEKKWQGNRGKAL